jgi:hypothetical protein
MIETNRLSFHISTKPHTTSPKIVAPHRQTSRWRLSRELLVLREHVTCAG